MKIYTKQGDAGETGLFGGPRVPKDDLRIRTYGTVDELNASLGLALAQAAFPAELVEPLHRVQGELFQLGAELATPRGKTLPIPAIETDRIEALEKEIDAMEGKLPPLKSFILPGGNPASASLHFARTVSRRAERELVSLSRQDPQRSEVLQYMNRLSDYLFVCARFANALGGGTDIPWAMPRKSK